MALQCYKKLQFLILCASSHLLHPQICQKALLRFNTQHIRSPVDSLICSISINNDEEEEDMMNDSHLLQPDLQHELLFSTLSGLQWPTRALEILIISCYLLQLYLWHSTHRCSGVSNAWQNNIFMTKPNNVQAHSPSKMFHTARRYE